MRFMMLIKSDEKTEAGAMPDEALLTAMSQYNEELVKSGALLSGEGLHPSSKGFRIHNTAGKLTVIDGPFAEAKELIAGFWMIEAKSKEEAIEWAKRVPFEADGPSATSGGTGQIEIRQVTELSDFPPDYFESGGEGQAPDAHGGNPGPAGPEPQASTPDGKAKLKYMMMFKSSKNTEAGILPDKKVFAEMGQAMGAMAATGVLISGEGLQPSSKGARVLFSKGKRTVMDGPFAETKELICGYVIVQVDSKEEAIEWAKRGLKIHGDGVSEARQVFQASDFGAEFTPELREAEERMREQIAQSGKSR
ncbi:hypothetical protein Sinac_3107 [Singulisphaera acidiphila DSM 18658]|uniref:YCII-related domain-containing protein n=2 Tax=Singulisphaera acidiphila TaxID=466153 RepID=L0DF11_SINAD|nr:YciI family protein [Singulisphaera acidiphila]AGA27388.1 hypothetical protein Sinac_3107 [Singulisphaera acidiphila DSM 18658]